jgi:uncharacterized protein YjdB
MKIGKITAKQSGNVIITAISTTNSNIQTSCKVSVYDYLKGDRNNDNSVNVTDAYLLLNDIATNFTYTTDKLKIVDLNDDNQINVTDAYLLLTFISQF